MITIPLPTCKINKKNNGMTIHRDNHAFAPITNLLCGDQNFIRT